MHHRSPFTIAEESLGHSSLLRNQQGMERTSAPKGPNLYDSGASSKVAVNSQPYVTERQRQQNVLQNTASAAPQANVGAVQQSRKLQLVEDNADYKANAFREQRKGEVMSVLGSPATLAMGNMSPPELASVRNHVATGKAMALGVNPDLVQNEVSARRYG